jgi:hypothetical protein
MDVNQINVSGPDVFHAFNTGIHEFLKRAKRSQQPDSNETGVEMFAGLSGKQKSIEHERNRKCNPNRLLRIDDCPHGIRTWNF